MRFPLAILSAVIAAKVLTGCTSYQFIKVANRLEQNEHSEMKYENDSIDIYYSLPEINGNFYVNVRNKSDRALYLDMSNSFIIIDQQSLPFITDYDDVNSASYIIKSEYLKKQNDKTPQYENSINTSIRHIKPYSGLIMLRPLITDYIELPKNSHATLRNVSISKNVGGNLYLFNEKDSPLQFKVLVTLSFDQGFENMFQVIETFWASEIIKSYDSLQATNTKPANTFQLSTMANHAVFMTGIALVVYSVAILSGYEGE